MPINTSACKDAHIWKTIPGPWCKDLTVGNVQYTNKETIVEVKYGEYIILSICYSFLLKYLESMQLEVYLSLNALALEMRLLTRLCGDFRGSGPDFKLATNILKLIILLICSNARSI